MIDLILGPLFRINPVKYAFDARYRAKLIRETGRESKFVFAYQIIFLMVWLFMVTVLIAGR